MIYEKRGLLRNMGKSIKDKRGDIIPEHLVALILVIVGFIVVIILLFSLEFENFQENEICRLSVLSRATSPVSVQGLIPLKCTTNKICITDDIFGKCEQFSGEKNVKTIRLTGSFENKAEKIEEVNVEAMYNCWQMMGEGKLDLFSGVKTNPVESILGLENLKVIKSSCVICSRVAIDKDFIYKKDSDGKFIESVNGATNDFKQVAELVDFNRYLLEKKPKGEGKTYWEIMSNEQLRVFPEQFEEEIIKGDKTNSENVIDQRALIFMQINTGKTPSETFRETAGKTYVSANVLAGSLGPIAVLFKWKTQAIIGAGALGTGGIAAFQSYRGRQLSAGYCGEFISQEEGAQNGCSLVLPLNFEDINQVNNYCSRIEGNP